MSAEPRSKREQILVAAERVFAQEGYHGTTMRTIADAAGLNLSLVVYHFEKKLALYREIFLRRQGVNEQRRALLRAVDLDAPGALAQVVAAFADPVLALHENPDDVWFARLVLREASDPSSQERGIVHELFDPMAEEFIAALRVVTPGQEPAFYPWAYLFAVGALTTSSHDTRISDLGVRAVGAGQVAKGPQSSKGRCLKGFIQAGWSGVP